MNDYYELWEDDLNNLLEDTELRYDERSGFQLTRHNTPIMTDTHVGVSREGITVISFKTTCLGALMLSDTKTIYLEPNEVDALRDALDETEEDRVAAYRRLIDESQEQS